MKFSKSHILLVILMTWVVPGVVYPQSDFERTRQRVIDDLTRPEVDDTKVDSLVASIRKDGTWPGINYQDISRTGFEHRTHSGNMVLLARAYQQETSRFYNDEQVKHTVEQALANWVDNDYSSDNWWHNQIGTPTNLVGLMLIMGDDLPPDLTQRAQPMIGRAHLNASGARPSGDRIKIAGILAKNLLFTRDTRQFAEVIRVIESEIKFAEGLGSRYGYGLRHNQGGLGTLESKGRGMQYDYSFHHRTDRVNNTLSYGLGYADALVDWAVYVAGTQYSFSEQKLKHLVDYFLDGICKTAVYGKFPDVGAKNRSISREGALRYYDARTAEGLLLSTNYRRGEVQEIADIRHQGIRPTRSHATFFWHSEHFTLQRPDFFTSVRMYSTRNHNMERPYNSEGLLNHHRGDGTNHVSRTGDEYNDLAPVFDFQKIPGATIVQKPKLPSEDKIQKLGLTDFVGAVTDGQYGTAAFDFKSPHDLLCARKAWFFFDNEYVALGAGISSPDRLPVVTTINQCLLRDDVTISTRDGESVIARGEREFNQVNWVYQDGIGYVFPRPATIKIKNNEATGSWYSISRQTDSPKAEISLDVFKLWLDHGVMPGDATYEYIVIPATSVERLREKSSRQGVRILYNTPEIQAVEHDSPGIIQAVFYRAGEIQASDGLSLTCDSPGIVMLRKEGQRVAQISVSDPNRELATIHLTLSTRIDTPCESSEASWNEEKRVSEISIDLPQGVYAGQSVTVDCRK